MQTYQELSDRARQLRARGVRGRYAPSPTGDLHLGNGRTALLAWLQARLAGGTLILRMEDLDQPRIRANSAAQILDDLRWLGLDWDEGPDRGGPLGPYEQQPRDLLYQWALDQLWQQGLVFACWCSRKDISTAASAPHAHGHLNVYPGTCRDAGHAFDGKDPRGLGRQPALRFRCPARVVTFQDRICGEVRQDLVSQVGDFVLRRADRLFAYQLAVVVDDALMGVSDVVRGADLLDSSPRQIELFQALGFPPPSFWHVPLLLDGQGKRMTKRDGAQTLRALRLAGLKPQQVIGSWAASLGLAPANSQLSAQELLKELNLTTLQQALQS